MKFLPAVLFVTVVASFGFSHCVKAPAGRPSRLDSLRSMNGDHAVAGRRTGIIYGRDASAGGAWVERAVDDSVETVVSVVFITEDTLIVAFNKGGTCLADGKYQLTDINIATQVATFKRFGWKETLRISYGDKKLTYIGGQSGIHESLVAELSSR